MNIAIYSAIALVGCALLSVSAGEPGAAQEPPKAPLRPVIDDYFGAKVTDPYRYMENLADPTVQSWIRSQADFTTRTLAAIPGREQLLKRVCELDEAAPYSIWVIRRWPNGDLHYLKRRADENLDKLYIRDGKTGQERLLVDPERFSTDSNVHYSLSFVSPSPDAEHIAYGIAAAGSERTVLHILESATGKDLPETIDRIEDDYLWPCWLPDGRSFVYSRRQKLAADGPQTDFYKRTHSCLHRLGSDPDRDPVVFEKGSSPAVALSDEDFPAVYLTAGSKFVIGQIKHGDANELTLYAAPVESLTDHEIPWKKICDVEDEVEDYAVHGDDVYLRSAHGATRYKVVRTSLARPDFSRAQVVVPASQRVLQGIQAARDALYVGVLDNGIERVWRLPFSDGEAREIHLPDGEASGFAFAANHDMDGVFIGTSSWTRGGRIYSYDPATNAMTDTRLRPRGKFDDVAGYESREVLVPSHDGVKVPLSIICKSGIALDGSHPTLVNGYGAYGLTTPMHFDPVRLAWLERGGVIAYAHVRGGGEFGKDWHLAGQKATKPNTWKDFIACCQYLVDQKYTSPATLAGQGGSAGGILIGRAITERTDLFAAAIVNVGCTDTLRMETTANGVPNIAEFGTVTNEAGFKGLLEMSTYQHIVDGTKYPAVLIVHGINDPRVEPWESAKLAARLQAATSSGKPILFRVDYDAGHGIGSTKKQRQKLRADEWAFLLWQMGRR